MENVRVQVLQAFMEQSIMKRKDCEAMCRRFCQVSNVPTAMQLPELIKSNNDRLEQYGMKLEFGKTEQDGTEWIGLVNTTRDEAAKKSSHMNLCQLEFFKLAIQLITANDGLVQSGVLLNACDSMERKLTKRSAQELLNKLVTDHWLCINRGSYSLGIRSILELLPFLDEITGEQIDKCCLCSTRVVMGQKCVQCGQKLHTYCVTQLTKTTRTIKCPSCHTLWT